MIAKYRLPFLNFFNTYWLKYSETMKPHSTEELTGILTRCLKAIFDNWQVDFAYLSGSWARGQNAWWSDVDLFISLPRISVLNPEEKLRTLANLHVIVERATSLKNVEISILEDLPPHIQFHALADGILIYERVNSPRQTFVERCLRQYFDHIIWYDGMLRQFLGEQPPGSARNAS